MTSKKTTPETTAQPQVIINAQYIKDLSFESPKSPLSLVNIKTAPKIDLSVDINVQKATENDYEVTLKINAKANNEADNLFVVELLYSGMFSLTNIPDEAQKEQVLLIYCPSLIFPFARRVIADVTRDGGFQPLMINPIDFASLYAQQKNQATAN
ncbi:MAG: protein-export chaperone SecB [Alphaproteobacteria bacterium]|jgi:preprotein translocase subunit SecB